MSAPEERNWIDLGLEAGRVFTPNTPIDERSLFAGRQTQLRRVVDVVNQKGQHGILFGERGVGKTSLSNVLSQFLSAQTQVLAPRVNCDGADSYESVWRKVFDQIELLQQVPGIGFNAPGRNELVRPSDWLAGDVTPDAVRRVLTLMSSNFLPILILDEFDRLTEEGRRAFADTIKSLSDHAVPATVLLVGVGDSVDQLIREHESVGRALVQIQMPRMQNAEIRSIIETGLQRLQMEIDEDALEKIARLAQGLPHYAHLLGLHSSRDAIDSRTVRVSKDCVNHAITKSMTDAQQSIRTAYHSAIRSQRRDNLFGDVLLACALAETDELGFFAAQDVRPPMRAITGRSYDIPTFAQHLNEFSDPIRGNILRKYGEKRRYRYRFSDPLMQPFVIMQGVVKNRVPPQLLEAQGDSD